MYLLDEFAMTYQCPNCLSENKDVHLVSCWVEQKEAEAVRMEIYWRLFSNQIFGDEE